MTTEVSLYFLTTLTFLAPRNQKMQLKTNLESLDSAGLLWLCLSFLSAQQPRLGRHFATLSLLFSKFTTLKKS